jgi:hypothetical protein
LRKYVIELRLGLDDLAAAIPVVVQSRERVSAPAGMMGGALAGMMGEALDQFRAEAQADKAAVEALRTRLDGIEPIRLFASFNTVQAKVVTAHEVRVRVQQLREKYADAAAVEARIREHLRAATVTRANRPEAWMYPMRRPIRAPESQAIIVSINGVRHTGLYAVAGGVVTVTYRGEELSSLVGASAKSTAIILLHELVRAQLKRGRDT